MVLRRQNELKRGESNESFRLKHTGVDRGREYSEGKYAGVKTCGTDQGMPALYQGAVSEIVASEEHFQLHGYTEQTAVGEKIRLIPTHCCSTVNLYDKIYLVDGDTVVDRILITAKGIGR